ncbi:protein disulfide oxidoreductase [Campylobacter iguaniorum]|uniref:Protein disulfide oxidoreductase n=1 Tax=Campylobacter iguaniorum TaxID=1244531 RepID=A0A076FAY1_9BACT|nr:disulfide isomerase [Campylobacter iguaniorum]AII15385.1 protein disulfide oxidoreductase [Campylobacter iguaniorum]ALV25315.1 protein disulfide oxidoreductase [Campylobacter iguaniorum]
MSKFRLFLGAITLFCAVSLNAITEGKDYIKLNSAQQIPDADDKIIELFSYSCIHCYNHFKGGTLEFVAELLPEFKYEEWQVRQMGDYGYLMGEVLAYAKMMDEANLIKSTSKKSAYHAVLKAYFEAYFKHRQRWNTGAAFYQVGADAIKEATKKDVSISDISEYASSDEGKKFTSRLDDGLEVAKLNGTPAFIIKGKYLVNLENVKSEDELVNIIKEIIKLK